MKAFRVVALLTAAALASGCAISPEQFSRQKHTLRIDEVCRGYLKAVETSNWAFHDDTTEELDRRQVSRYECSRIVKESNERAAGALTAVLLGAAIIAVAASSGGGGGDYVNPYAPVHDYDWAWDQFFNEYYALVWACRGMQSGQFAALEKCAYKFQNDYTWPSKRADSK